MSVAHGVGDGDERVLLVFESHEGRGRVGDQLAVNDREGGSGLSDRQRKAGDCRDREPDERQAISLDVGVVGDEIEAARFVLGDRSRVDDRDRRVVDRFYRDADRAFGAAALAVGHDDREAVGAVDIGVRTVGPGTGRCVKLYLAIGGAGAILDRIAQGIAVHIRSDDLAVDRRILVGLDRERRCRRRIVDRLDREGGSRLARTTASIGDLVAERSLAVEVARRREADAALVEDGRTASDRGDAGHPQAVEIRIGVVADEAR
ncbi:hypothetical protein D9M68_600700 [compost metagenome]